MTRSPGGSLPPGGPSPRAILLDLDGTLLDTPIGRASARAATGALVETDLGIPSARWAESEARAASEIWDRLGDDWVHGRIATRDVSERIVAQALTSIDASADLAPRLVTLFAQTALDGARLFPDARPLIRAAKDRGIALAVVTNGADDTQRGALRATGILDAVDYVAVSAEHGVAKPDPRLFRVALRELGVAPERAWHVGDRLGDDVGGAHAAGIAAVWVDRTGAGRGADDPDPDAVVRDLDGVVELLGPA